ncbi:amidohydrolase family protein [Nonomuraea fuscirosea]
MTDVAGGASGEGVRRVDGAGRFVVPGYNNMHSHALAAERPALVLAAMLAEGVTGFRQMSGSPEMLEDRADGRLPLGVHAPALLGMPGDLLMPFNAGSAEDAEKEVARQKEQGADFIKLILVERPVFFAAMEAAKARGLKVAGHLPPSISPLEAARAGFGSIEHFGAGDNLWIACSANFAALQARVDTGLPVPSFVVDMPFAGDVFMSRMEKRLINPSAYTEPEAAALLRDALDSYDEARCRELARAFKAYGTWQVPTLVRLRTQELADAPEYETDPWLAHMSDATVADWREATARFRALPAATRETFRRAYDLRLRVVALWHEEGVPMLTGTDGQGKVPGQTMRQEFGELAKAGLSPLAILRMSTTAAAEYLGRADRMGLVAPGMEANFLLLDADPVRDVGNLTRVSAVVRAGHFLPLQELQAVMSQLGKG